MVWSGKLPEGCGRVYQDNSNCYTIYSNKEPQLDTGISSPQTCGGNCDYKDDGPHVHICLNCAQELGIIW